MSNESDVQATGISGRRRFTRWLIIISSLIALSYWAWQRYTHVYTDDARIAANMIEISSRVSGWVSDLPHAQGEHVKKGTVIATINSSRITLQLKELEASLLALGTKKERLLTQKSMVEKQTKGSVDAAQSVLKAAKASLASASSEVDLRHSDWQRSQQLREKNILSLQEWENTRNEFRKAEEDWHFKQAERAEAQAKLVEAQAGFDNILMLERELQTLTYEKEQLLLRIEQLQVTLDDHHLLSPIDAVIDKTYIDPGEYVSPGKRLLLMHNPEKIWINAAVKETSIRFLKPGMSAEITVDAYPDLTLLGEIVRIGESTTSQFSLLPSTNPSGNFTKITQRIPIKIAIAANDRRLRPGMMVEVAINVR